MTVKNNSSILKESIGILNTCLIFVLMVYLIDAFYVRWLYLNLGILAMIILVPAKIYVLGGIYGSIAELISYERYTLSFQQFNENARKYWIWYFGLSSALLLTHIFLTINRFISPDFTFNHAYAHFNIFITCIMSIIIIKNKYINAFSLGKRKIKLSAGNITTLLMLHLAQLVFFYIPYYYYNQHFDVPGIMSLIVNYLYLLTFIFIGKVILSQYPEVEKHYSPEKEIFFVNPLGGGIFFNIGSMLMPHSTPAFVVLRALTPKDYSTREFSFKPWSKRFYRSNKLVAITCFTSNCSDAYKIAREFKRHGSKVVIGGPHVSYVSDEALEFCDSVVLGEAESVWQQIIHDYENDCMKKKYMGEALDNCHEVVQQELLNSPPEIIKDFLETSRGCKFKCRFCMVPDLTGGKLRTKPVFDVVELLKRVKTKYKEVTFIDNNIYSDPAYARELFKAIKPLKIKWSTQCTIDIAKNDETLRLAKEAGCTGFLIGFEITEGSFEKSQGGKFSMADNYQKYAKKIRDMGMKIKAHFIFGFETDRLKNLGRFWKFSFSVRPFITVLSILTPFPGTMVYDDMLKEDRITNLNWRNYGCQSLVFRHDHISNFVLSRAWPFIYVFFFLTTSRLGHLILLFSSLTATAYFIKFL